MDVRGFIVDIVITFYLIVGVFLLAFAGIFLDVLADMVGLLETLFSKGEAECSKKRKK